MKGVSSFKKLGCILDQEMPIKILKSSRDTPLEGISDLLMIETNLMVSSTTNWIIDSGSNVYLCTSMQDLKDYKRLRLEEMILCVGNRARVTAVIAEPILFNYCYYVPK